MIVADTNLVSTFARIERLDLLFAVAETDALYLPPAVIKEIKAGLHNRPCITSSKRGDDLWLPWKLNCV